MSEPMNAQGRGRFADFRAGLLAVSPVMVAAVPIGGLFGSLAAQKGLAPLEALFMSLTVFAGASQFVALDLWSDPLSWLVVSVAVFLVNLRHVLMGASLAPYIAHEPLPRQMMMAFFMTDEAWAMALQRATGGRISRGYYMGVALGLYVVWNLSTYLGALFGAVLPNPALYGLDFAFTVLFIVLLTGFWQGWRTAPVLAASAGVAVLVSMLSPGPWSILAGGLAGVSVALFLPGDESVKDTGEASSVSVEAREADHV